MNLLRKARRQITLGIGITALLLSACTPPDNVQSPTVAATDTAVTAETTKMTESKVTLVDCPLRDEPYSLTSPVMDILLKPEAKAVVNRYTDNMLDNVPQEFMSTQAPSFSAILDLPKLLGMGGKAADPDLLATIDTELRALEITEDDRVARCARYDREPPELVVPEGKPRILLFEKMTGFRDGPSVEAAAAALKAMAESNGWAMVATEQGAAMTPSLLSQFDAVIWNNISGDILTLTQRQAFKDYIESGGGYVGIHGSGGDPIYFWDWYVDELIGARFVGHSMDPQFQDAKVDVEQTASGIAANLPKDWVLNDEWYAFKPNPRDTGASVIATLDESTFSQVGRGGQNLAMGDHPIAWTRCVGKGRSFYSAIGHRPEIYSEPNHLQLLKDAILWAAGAGNADCKVDNQSSSK